MSHPGQLRVYLGAAPGVGKTFAMLDEGHRRAERGTDVVVGYVETHGRPRTAEAVEGLEVVPRQPVGYRGVETTEMDLDAVLARRPQVASWTSWPTPTLRQDHRRATRARTPSAGRTCRCSSPPASTW